SKIDNYNWYQARNVREEVLKATAAQMHLQALAQPPAVRAEYEKQAAKFDDLAKDQEQKKAKQKEDADNADKRYDALNLHDDQFDLSAALLAVAISLLALTSLTQKRWLFGVAMIPTFFGVLMGLAGLLGWRIHPDTISSWLS